MKFTTVMIGTVLAIAASLSVAFSFADSSKVTPPARFAPSMELEAEIHRLAASPDHVELAVPDVNLDCGEGWGGYTDGGAFGEGAGPSLDDAKFNAWGNLCAKLIIAAGVECAACDDGEVCLRGVSYLDEVEYNWDIVEGPFGTYYKAWAWYVGAYIIHCAEC